MKTTTRTGELLGNSIVYRLAALAQALGTVLHARSSRTADVTSSGEQTESREMHERERLEAAAQATLFTLHQ